MGAVKAAKVVRIRSSTWHKRGVLNIDGLWPADIVKRLLSHETRTCSGNSVQIQSVLDRYLHKAVSAVQCHPVCCFPSLFRIKCLDLQQICCHAVGIFPEPIISCPRLLTHLTGRLECPTDNLVYWSSFPASTSLMLLSPYRQPTARMSFSKTRKGNGVIILAWHKRKQSPVPAISSLFPSYT